jgi:hypothetical protein
LFNLFSCYGIILKIKIFGIKSDSALVEYQRGQMVCGEEGKGSDVDVKIIDKIYSM